MEFHPNLPKDARALIEDYMSHQRRIMEAAENQLDPARERLFQRLQELQNDYTRQAELDPAVLVRDALKSCRANFLSKTLDIFPDPGNLVKVALAGQAKEFLYRVSGQVIGSVWGTDVYTTDSALAVAAVHAGCLGPDEVGVVKVTIEEGQDFYRGSTRNGIASKDWEKYQHSYRVELP